MISIKPRLPMVTLTAPTHAPQTQRVERVDLARDPRRVRAAPLDLPREDPEKEGLLKADPAKEHQAKVDLLKEHQAKADPEKVDLLREDPEKVDLLKVDPEKEDQEKVDPEKEHLAKVDPEKEHRARTEAVDLATPEKPETEDHQARDLVKVALQEHLTWATNLITVTAGAT